MSTNNCSGTSNTPIVYTQETCKDCNPQETTINLYTPQACIKIVNKLLASCSVDIPPADCTRIVKIYSITDLVEPIFTGTYANANIFAKSLSLGNYYAKEIITCENENTQTESNELCFEVYLIETVKFVKTSCKCCEKPLPIAYDAKYEIDCNECVMIDFLNLFKGPAELDTVNISVVNPVIHGVLTNQTEPYIKRFCPTSGYSGSFYFGFTITDVEENTTEEKSIFITVRANCPTDPILCEDTTVTVKLLDVIDDTPITSVSYPIDVFSPFSQSSGTIGNLGSAANYAAIITKLNADSNKPAGITFIANVNQTKIDVNGTCDFSDIKIGDSIRELIETMQGQINVLVTQNSNQQVQIDNLILHQYDCCGSPPAGLDIDFLDSEFTLCYQNGASNGKLIISPINVVGTGADYFEDITHKTKITMVSVTAPSAAVPTVVHALVPERNNGGNFNFSLNSGIKTELMTGGGGGTITFYIKFHDASLNLHVATISAAIPTLTGSGDDCIPSPIAITSFEIDAI